MKIAVFSDIHSNFYALSNVLNDIKEQNVDRVYCLGDLVGYGPHPNTVIEKFIREKIATVMGNYDRGIGNNSGDCGCAYVSYEDRINGQKSINWTTKVVTQENKDYLKSLNREIKFELMGYNVLLVHGSPYRINEYLYKEHLERKLSRFLESRDFHILICGHTHIPYHKIVNNVHVINDGSVGKPKDGDNRACYVMIDFSEDLSVEFRRIKYNISKVSDEIKKFGLPEAFSEALYTAR
jgi:putative phosphoesterase